MLIEELNNCRIDIQSYLLLKEGLKPVIRIGLVKSMAEDVKKYVRLLGLKLLIKEFKEMYGEKLPEPIINIYCSLDKELCKEALHAEREGNRKKFGQLLGYPECCVDNFIENHKKDLILLSLRNVKTKPSFHCNNLFVFDSKVRNFDMQKYQNNLEIFDNPNIRDLFLIRYVPCSFDCKKSVRIGKITLKLLKNNHPDLAKKIVNVLKNPVIYWNYFEWIILNGHPERNVIKYNEVLNYESLVKKGIKKMLGRGDNIKITDDKIVVFKNSEKIGEITRKNDIPVCIDFQ